MVVKYGEISRGEPLKKRNDRSRLLSDEDDEDPGEEESEDATDDDFARAMSHALLEAGEFGLIDFTAELIDEHVEVATLIAENHADTERVIDDDEGESGRHREDAGMDTLIVSDRGEEGDGEGGVRARHVPMGEGIAPVEAVLHGIDDEFEDLYEERDDDRDKEDR